MAQTVQELVAQGIPLQDAINMVTAQQAQIPVPSLADLGSSVSNRLQRDQALAVEAAQLRALGVPQQGLNAVPEKIAAGISGGVTSLGDTAVQLSQTDPAALVQELVRAKFGNSPATNAVLGLVGGGAKAASDLGAQLNSKLDFFRSVDNPGAIARKKAKQQEQGQGQTQEEQAQALLKQLGLKGAGGGVDAAGSGGLIFGQRAPLPSAPTLGTPKGPDFSAARKRLESLRGLAGTDTDLSQLESILQGTKPTGLSEKELKDLKTSSLFEGLASAGSRISGDTPAGTAILQLGLGALAGDAAGKKAELAAKKSFDEELRQFAQAELAFQQFKLDRVDAQLQEKRKVELTALGVDQAEAEAVAQTEQQQANAIFQQELVTYQAELQRAQQLGQGKIIGADKNGVITYTTEDEKGQQILKAVNGAQLVGGFNFALKQGGTKGATAALMNGRQQGPAAMAMNVIQLLDSQGQLPQLFSEEFLAKLQKETIAKNIPLTAFGTPGNKEGLAAVKAQTSAVLANALLQSDVLLLQALQLAGLVGEAQ